MSAAAAPRRRRWPVALISSALLLLALGAVAVGHLYWTSLHDGLARTRGAIEQAQRRQLLLAEQVRAAQTALLAKQQELARREAALGAGGAAQPADHEGPGSAPRTAGEAASQAAGGVSLRGVDPALLLGRLEAMRRDAALLGPPRRLPASAGPLPFGDGPPLRAVAPGRLIRDQLEVARVAVLLGDAQLLDHAAAAVQRLLLGLYPSRGRAGQLHERLDALRASLKPPPQAVKR
jgi:hypothetical protein